MRRVLKAGALHSSHSINIVLYRAPEILFQPTMVGVDQCGVSDTIEYVLQSFPSDLQQRLVEVTPLISTH